MAAGFWLVSLGSSQWTFLTTSSAFEHCFDGLQYFIHAHCYTSDGLSSSLWSPERQLVPFSQSQWCGSFAPKVSSGARALTHWVIRISQTSLFLSPHHFSICRVTTEGDVTQNTTYFAQCFNLTSKQKANTQAETCQTWKCIPSASPQTSNMDFKGLLTGYQQTYYS